MSRHDSIGAELTANMHESDNTLNFSWEWSNVEVEIKLITHIIEPRFIALAKFFLAFAVENRTHVGSNSSSENKPVGQKKLWLGNVRASL